ASPGRTDGPRDSPAGDRAMEVHESDGTPRGDRGALRPSEWDRGRHRSNCRAHHPGPRARPEPLDPTADSLGPAPSSPGPEGPRLRDASLARPGPGRGRLPSLTPARGEPRPGSRGLPQGLRDLP